MTRKIYGLALVTAAGLLHTSPAQAFSPAHIDRLALTLQRQTADLHREVHLHFRPTPAYRHLDDDVTAMENLARHIHDIAHHTGAIGHLRRDVEEFDRLFHHVEDLVRQMAVTGRIDRRTYAHLQGELADIDRTLHHLRDDLADLGHGPGRGPIGYPGVVVPGGYRPAPYAPTGGFGLRIPLGDRGAFTLLIPIR